MSASDETDAVRPSRATCVCCRNLGVLPTVQGPQTYAVGQPDGSVQMHYVEEPTAVAGDVVQQMCDECVIAAFLSNGQQPHPHRVSQSLRARGVKGRG